MSTRKRVLATLQAVLTLALCVTAPAIGVYGAALENNEPDTILWLLVLALPVEAVAWNVVSWRLHAREVSLATDKALKKLVGMVTLAMFLPPVALGLAMSGQERIAFLMMVMAVVLISFILRYLFIATGRRPDGD